MRFLRSGLFLSLTAAALWSGCGQDGPGSSSTGTGGQSDGSAQTGGSSGGAGGGGGSSTKGGSSGTGGAQAGGGGGGQDGAGGGGGQDDSSGRGGAGGSSSRGAAGGGGGTPRAGSGGNASGGNGGQDRDGATGNGGATNPDAGPDAGSLPQSTGSASASVTATTTLAAVDGSTVTSNDSSASNVAASGKATIQQSLTVNSPKRWSPSDPYLYQIKVELKVDGNTVDTYLAPLGIRTFAFDPNSGLSLNGQNMKRQGMCMHHDLGALGAAINYRAVERQAQILKDVGANAIRTSHNPPAPELLDIADRLGMLIMDEAFDTWTQDKTTNDYGRYFNQWAQQDIQDMVRRDRNHPSIVMYSIGNEVGGATTSTAQKLKDWVLALDKTRAITWASNKMGSPHVSEGDDRNVAKLLDVVGYNYAPYTGDYDPDHEANPTWVILGSETNSALSSRGIYHTPADTITHSNDGTSDKHCSSYDNRAARYRFTARETYAYHNSQPYVAGSFAWTGFDYIGEPTPHGWPAKSSYSSIVDTAGFPKDSSYFQMSRWITKPMVHLLPHWNWSNGTTVTVFAYSNCDSVEFFLNDKSQGSKTPTSSELNCEWNVPWASGTLRAKCKVGWYRRRQP